MVTDGRLGATGGSGTVMGRRTWVPEMVVAQTRALPLHAHMMPQVAQRPKAAVVQEPK